MSDRKEKYASDRITIRTVAADSQVSVAAVSKVLRKAYGVSGALRDKVEASIARLGYRPSIAARGMRGQIFTLGVLLVGIDNPFLPAIYQGIESITEAAGYKIMVGVGAARTRTEVKLIEQMIDNRMDGLILVASKISGETLERFAQQIPMVVVGHHEPAALGYDTINNDDRNGARIAVQDLLEKGYHDIAMVCPVDFEDHPADVTPQRVLGYYDVMNEAGHAGRLISLLQSGDARDAAIQAFLQAPNRPRAVFCWSDLDAIPLINQAFALGVRIPQDLAVVGYDNSPVASLPLINLSSVDQHGFSLGKLSGEAILSRINGRTAAEHITLQPTLILRGSA